jgi:hypothetical protein
MACITNLSIPVHKSVSEFKSDVGDAINTA